MLGAPEGAGASPAADYRHPRGRAAEPRGVTLGRQRRKLAGEQGRRAGQSARKVSIGERRRIGVDEPVSRGDG